jgi:hypothetical protein
MIRHRNYLNVHNLRKGRSFPGKSLKKGIAIITLDLDGDTFGRIQHKALEVQRFSEAINERSEANSLNNSSD